MIKPIYTILLGLLFGAAAAWLVNHVQSNATPVVTSYADAASKAAPSVVNIYTTKLAMPDKRYQGDDPLLRYFFNQRQKRFQQKRELSLGSGVILNKQGFILTNLHVINNAQEILVLLYDGREALARVVGVDKDTDLAVLKIDLEVLVAIDIGPVKNMRVGDPVLAIGNPYGFGQTVTAGIISATGRYGLNLNTYEDYIQTDAAINIGSSGGALINTQGQLIGINSAIYSQTGSSQGIGLAIPVDIAAKVMTDIIRHGQVVRGWLGLEVTQLNGSIAQRLGIQQTSGVVITSIYENGPADQAGLVPGDIIISIHKKKIDTGQTGLLEVANLEPGQMIEMEVIRDNQTLVLRPVVGVRSKG